MSAILDRFRQYPPVLRWLLIVLVVIGGWILWQDVIGSLSRSWDERAGEYESVLARAEASGQRLNPTTQAAILALGPAEPLGNEVEGTEALSDLINDVLSAHGVVGREVSTKPRIAFKPNQMTALAASGGKGERVMAEVRFEASQEDAFLVVAELESHPKVESVSKVRIAKANDMPGQDSRRVVVQLTAEAWVIVGRPGAPVTPMPAAPRTPSAPEEERSDEATNMEESANTTLEGSGR